MKTAFSLKKISRLLIIIVGVSLTTSFLALGIGLFTGQFSQVQQLNDSVNYEKMYFFDQEIYSDNKNVAYLTEAKLKKDEAIQSIQLIGLHPTGDVYQKDIYSNLEDNTIVLAKNIAQRNNLKEQDRLKLAISGVELTFTVAHILNNNYENRCFVPLSTLYQEVLAENQFNLFYQKKNASMLDGNFPKATRVEAVSTFEENNMNNFSQIFSVLIVILVFALIASLSVHDNMEDMKVMQLLGYRSFFIFRATTATYLFSIIGVFLLWIAVFPFICRAFEQLLNVGNWQFYIGIDSSIITYLISATIVILNYYLWMSIVFRKCVPKK